jgi:hypothetical protein
LGYRDVMARCSLQPLEAIMPEIFFVLSLLVVLVWVIIRAVLLVVDIDAPGHIPDDHNDPITTYVEENYGSHFQDDPLPINRNLRNL